MSKEIRARYSGGVIEPLEKLELKDGQEIIISVKEVPSLEITIKALKSTAGAWKGNLDFEAYLKDLYTSRRSQGPEVTL